MDYKIASLKEHDKDGAVSRLPFSIRILLENILRNQDGFAITEQHLDTILHWNPEGTTKEIPYKPSRVLMQDFTGVPAVVDIASIRSEVIRRGKDGSKINPAVPVELVIDHSVQVDFFGTTYSYARNVEYEYKRNKERYQLLKWAQQAFDNFTVVPPGLGICHQVNLEYFAQVATKRDGWAFPDTLVGLDSHTPIGSGMRVGGWRVRGIEAVPVMVNLTIELTARRVLRPKPTARSPEGTTSTDIGFTITGVVRQHGVVGKFFKVFGEHRDHLSVPD